MCQPEEAAFCILVINLPIEETGASWVAQMVKKSACREGDLGSIPGSGRSPWRKARQPTPVFLPGEFRGQRSLVGSSPWGRKESDTTEQLTQRQNEETQVVAVFLEYTFDMFLF